MELCLQQAGVPLAYIGKLHKFGRFWVKQEQLRSNNLFLFARTSSGTLKRSRIFSGQSLE